MMFRPCLIQKLFIQVVSAGFEQLEGMNDTLYHYYPEPMY